MFDDFFAITLMTLEDGSLVHADICCCLACWEQECSEGQDEDEQHDFGCQCPLCHERMLWQIEENQAAEQRRSERLRYGW